MASGSVQKLSRQTFQDFDILIVDSGSTDGTLDIIEQNPKTRLFSISQEDFGYSFALNYGIERTDSPYICIISGHSVPISNKWLEKAVQWLENNEHVAAVTGGYYDLWDAPLLKKITIPYILLKWTLENPRETNFMTNTNSLVRRSLWEQYPFDERLEECEDYDWAQEMKSRNRTIIHHPAFNVLHSHHHKPNSTPFEQKQDKWRKINQEIENRHRPFGGVR